MKATAQAPANIAFIKYWGKADEVLRLPLNSSISMNLSDAYTITTVDFSSKYENDLVTLLDGDFSEKENERIIKWLTRIRTYVKWYEYARVVTKNTFPKGAGSAASASGFAALTVAAVASMGIVLPEKELSIFSRLGSGSACRSIPDGFVEWKAGKTSEESYAYSIYPHEYWDIRDILVIVDSRMKKISTTEGMELSSTSPFLPVRLAAIPDRINKCKRALAEKDFRMLGEIIEEDCLDMHYVMQTQIPPLLYWNNTTRVLMNTTKQWRNQGVPVYFTIDAGPNVHLVCEQKDEQSVLEKLRIIKDIESIIINKPAEGARCINDYLF